jgi:hypothetical protein
MCMVSDFAVVWELASVTCTVKLLVPEPVGVPLITPVEEFNVNPDGRLPDVIDQV